MLLLWCPRWAGVGRLGRALASGTYVPCPAVTELSPVTPHMWRKERRAFLLASPRPMPNPTHPTPLPPARNQPHRPPLRMSWEIFRCNGATSTDNCTDPATTNCISAALYEGQVGCTLCVSQPDALQLAHVAHGARSRWCFVWFIADVVVRMGIDGGWGAHRGGGWGGVCEGGQVTQSQVELWP